ncbi:uncharacterized protein LOC133814786 [Humulus lupulus]|uniref:uncharacterized protein LOC133814786 n=1 Tax=Humulus lupulus TaxID=3486 RepID=UPI002B409B10|nr:uncharacterized protein LOC133814786 [Humulus lupulus]
MKGVMHFGKRGKLSPRYIGPFEILAMVGHVAYRLALSPTLAETHNIFHISMLRKYMLDPSHVLSYESLELRQDLSYNEKPERIMERGVEELGTKKIPLVKVLWKNNSKGEATWELKKDMRDRYPKLLGEKNFDDEIPFKEGIL